MNLKLVMLLVTWLLLYQSCDTPEEPKSSSENPLNFTAESGTIITIAGKGPDAFGYSGNGKLSTEAELDWVVGVTVDPVGDVYIANGASNTIRKIYASSGIMQTYAGAFLGIGVTDPSLPLGDNGPALEAHLNIPLAIHADADGDVILLDAGNSRIREIHKADSSVHKVAGGGVDSWTSFGGDGGPATAALFNNPYGVATDAQGNIYIADQFNHSIRMINKATGVITTIAGKGPDHAGYSGDNGPATQAMLNMPVSVAVDQDGNIYIADSGNHVIRKVTNGNITTIAGSGVSGYIGDGAAATSAKLNSPRSLAVDKLGNVYVVDMGNNVIRQINSNGVISTYVGTGAAGYTGDGGAAHQATINSPAGIAVDSNGNLYIADTNNAVVRVVIK